jgi:NAD-dependent dihydropyrimidine dehydrogenase PreA subunit
MNMNNEIFSAQKLYTRTLCVHLKLYICVSFCPVEQLIMEHMIGMATTTHLQPILC